MTTPAPVLRDYQVAAIAAARLAVRAGVRATLLILPVGTGKTIVFASIAALAVAKGGRVLVLAHRGELLQQAIRKLREAGVAAALEQGPNRAGDSAVVVASVQTLKGKRLESWAPDAFVLIIVDEAHHSVAATYRAIFDRFAGARIVGVTATGDRADGQGLGAVYQSVAFEYKMTVAIEAGWLVRLRARRVLLALDLDTVSTTAGDLDRAELAAMMTEPPVVAACVAALLAEVGDRPCVVFAVTVEHAQTVAALLNDARPGCAVAISGESSGEERVAAALNLATGAVQFVCNVGVWTEGVDVPCIAAVAILRPTKSRSLYVQMVGRGTRLHPGKTEALVLDFTGLTKRHRLIGPADVLADDLPDDLVELVGEQFDTPEGADPLVAIEKARAAVAEQLKLGLRRWVVEEVVDLLGPVDLGYAADRPESASSGQLAALERIGLEPPPGLTRGQASRLLDALDRRRHLGLATVRQIRALRRFGLTATRARELRFEAATALLKRCIAARDGRRAVVVREAAR